MGKKLYFFALMCAVLMSTHVYCTLGAEEITKNNDQLPKQVTKTRIISYGPLFSQVTEIEIHDGPALQTNRIQRMVNRKLFHYFRPSAILPVRNLNFTLRFVKDVPVAGCKYAYYSILNELENGRSVNRTILFNEEHSIHVSSFSGIFIFKKAQPFNQWKSHPAQFMFIGSCQNVTLLT